LEEMHSNAALFMGAGTETTATELAGLLYNLTTNPDKMKILVKEIRAEFQHDSDITMERLPRLKYLHACIEEGLRLFMPVPIGLPRINKNGAEVAGVWVPGGVNFARSNF
jgi:cytochrome P450